MATLLRQLQTRVATVTEVVSKYNKQVLEKNKHYIADHPTVEKCQASVVTLIIVVFDLKRTSHARNQQQFFLLINRKIVLFYAGCCATSCCDPKPTEESMHRLIYA